MIKQWSKICDNQGNTALAVVFAVILCAVFSQNLTAEPSKRDSLEAALRAHPQADTTRVAILNQLIWHLRSTDIKQAMQYGKEAFALEEKIGDKRGMVETYSFVGVCARNMNDYGLASEMYLKQLLLAEEINYTDYIFYALNNIGNLYIQQEDWQNALSYFKRTLPFLESKGSVKQRCYGFINLGRSYAGLQQYDTAMKYFEKVRFLRAQQRDTAEIIIVLNDIANMYFSQHKDDEALKTHRELLALASEKEGRLIARSFAQLAIIFQRRSMLDSSNDYAQRAVAVSKRISRAETLAQGLRVLAENAAAVKDFSEAFRLHVEYATVRDSLFRLNGVKEVSALQARYEVEKKQREIVLLNSESQRQQLMRNILIGGFFVVLAFAVLIAYRYREKNRTEAIIRQQNEHLQTQAEEITTINEELSAANTALSEQNTTLNMLNIEKNEMMGIVSHDLKNPIGAVRGLAELVQQGFVEQEQVPEIIGQIVSTADRMLELVKNLLDVNQLESGGMQFQTIEFDIAPMIESTVWQYQSQAEAKSILLHFRNEAPNTVIHADEQAMMQVLDNLVSNAVKYSPQSKNIFVRLKSSPDAVRVEVQDEGPGISEEDMKKLFGKFVRLSARPTGGEHSTGLGLSIVKKMVEAMQGRVWCESELGKGAMFIVELPVTKRL